MARFIPLTQGQFAVVDDADYDFLSKYKWCARWVASVKSFYAVRTEYSNGGRTDIYMHRALLGLAVGVRLQSDHINHETLDNRRDNLRIATCAQNNRNQRRRSTNASGFKGIYLDKRTRRWQAEIVANGKRTHLGRFSTPELAHGAYISAAEKLHGEFACLA